MPSGKTTGGLVSCRAHDKGQKLFKSQTDFVPAPWSPRDCFTPQCNLIRVAVMLVCSLIIFINRKTVKTQTNHPAVIFSWIYLFLTVTHRTNVAYSVIYLMSIKRGLTIVLAGNHFVNEAACCVHREMLRQRISLK